ncbi:MAG: phytanoyl-CoA dioxygenase family protein [Proteobacteria bacterium]|nr:phytanoyl-CoA dioxygenase family protein [Pseudomonadota bacterium]
MTERSISAENLLRVEFWRAFAPLLHVGEISPAPATTPLQSFERLGRRLAHDGYFSDRDVRLEQLAPTLGQTIRALVAFGLPTVLVWAYDEPWECFRRLSGVIGHFLGPNYKALPAFWAWHVDPKNGEAGWRPHRDKKQSLTPDGSPLSLTCWIPLSEATPLNSCIYVIPAYLDPNYRRTDEAEPTYPHLARALPAKPGDFFIWNQVVLHWGGMTSEFADEPRMSMALEFQRGDIAPFQQPLLDHSKLPSFADRVRLIAHQILQYTHMYAVPQKHVQLAQFLKDAPLDAA